MAKLTRVPAKVFAANAAADEIGQFGSAVAGSKLETADVATIQGLSAWLSGWSEALVSGNRYPALQEMNGAMKVLSYQGAYALQEGIPEYDSATTYYIGSIVKKTGTFELYGSLTDDNVGNALADVANWKLLINLDIAGYSADTANMPTLTNNSTDTNNDIDFSAGFCYDLMTNVKITNTALTKRLDANFTTGTNQGGLDTGSKANSTIYSCFAISKTDGTSDFLFSTSATSPTLPSGFVNKRRIGYIITNSSGNIRSFLQFGNYFQWLAPTTDVNVSNLGTTAVLYTLPVPPNCLADMNISGYASVTTAIYVANPNCADVAPDTTLGYSTLRPNIAGNISQNTARLMVNSSSQIRARSANISTTFVVLVVGYEDKRGVN